jgi:hypothetical protein
MTNSLIGDILAITSDALQFLDALITTGLVVGHRARSATGICPLLGKARPVNSNDILGSTNLDRTAKALSAAAQQAITALENMR